MRKWFLLFICFCVCGQLAAQFEEPESDSIRVREIRSGIYALSESISEKVFNKSTGYGFEIGAYQERKLLGQVYWSYGAGAQLRDYNDTGILIDTTPNTDTAIIAHFYDVSHREIKLSTQTSIRFNYINNPNIYLIVGFGPEISFSQSVSNDFLFTRYIDSDFVTILEETSPAFPVDDDEFKINAINLRVDIGLGIELKNFNIEIVNRSNNVQGIGIRLKYTFDTLIY